MKLGATDSDLANLISTTTIPGDYPRPPQEAVVVVHRGRGGSRHFGWISGDSYCLGHSFQGAHSITCGLYDDDTATLVATGADYAPARAVGRLRGFNDRMPSENAPHQYYYTFAVVIDDAGPFRLTGDDHRGVLYQARAVLKPDRAVTFVEWGYYGPEIPLHAKICSSSSHRCLTDAD